MKIPASRKSQKESNFERINPHAAGIDIGSGEHWVCVPAERAEPNIRCFSCFTPDLMALAEWLIECQVETVAMEATGVYWISLFQILEAKGLEVNLVNAHHVKTEDPPPARKGKKRKKAPGNEPNFNLHGHLFRLGGVDFTQIDGLNVLTVQTILSEVGLDPTRFPTVKHFCSWRLFMSWFEDYWW